MEILNENNYFYDSNAKDLKLNGIDNSGNTLLHIFCRYGNKDLIELFLNLYNDRYIDTDIINLTNNDGISPLLNATKHDRTEIMNILLNHNVNINQQSTEVEFFSNFNLCLYKLLCGYVHVIKIDRELQQCILMYERKIKRIKNIIIIKKFCRYKYKTW